MILSVDSVPGRGFLEPAIQLSVTVQFGACHQQATDTGSPALAWEPLCALPLFQLLVLGLAEQVQLLQRCLRQ